MQATGRVALITGANKGIGFEVARQIAAAGWTVLAAARDQGRGNEAAGKLHAEGLDVHFIHLDLDDLGKQRLQPIRCAKNLADSIC